MGSESERRLYDISYFLTVRKWYRNFTKVRPTHNVKPRLFVNIGNTFAKNRVNGDLDHFHKIAYYRTDNFVIQNKYFIVSKPNTKDVVECLVCVEHVIINWIQKY